MLRHLVSRTSRHCAAIGIIVLVTSSDSLDDNKSFVTSMSASFLPSFSLFTIFFNPNFQTPFAISSGVSISSSPHLRQLFFHPPEFALQGFASSLLFSSPIGGSYIFHLSVYNFLISF